MRQASPVPCILQGGPVTLTDPLSLAVIAAAFVAGGFVKGFAGMGLPLVTVAALTFAFGLPVAVMLMVVPGLVTNLWQAIGGSETGPAMRRIWPFLVACCACVWFGTGVLASFDADLLVVGLGLLLAGYAFITIAGVRIDVPPSQEWWMAPVFGAVNGVACGITGITSVPSVLYVNGLGMPRERMIQAMGMLFGLSYVAISVALWLRGMLSVEVGTLSFLAVLPALAGMWIGRRARSGTSDAGFRRAFNWLLLAIGVYLIVRGLA